MELNKALSIADEIVHTLSPHCGLINVAGSCRRGKPEVKDIEIVCLPKRERHIDLLTGGWNEGARSRKFADVATTLGKVLKGSLVTGKYVQLALEQGIKLDLFMPADDDYYRQFAIRTGSGDYSHFVIARGWNEIGWCGVDGDLRRYKDCIKAGDKWKCVNPKPELPPVWTSEQEFFDWIQVPYLEPRLRTV